MLNTVEVTICLLVSTFYMKWINRTKFRGLDKVVAVAYGGLSLGTSVFCEAKIQRQLRAWGTGEEKASKIHFHIYTQKVFDASLNVL